MRGSVVGVGVVVVVGLIAHASVLVRAIGAADLAANIVNSTIGDEMVARLQQVPHTIRVRALPQ